VADSPIVTLPPRAPSNVVLHPAGWPQPKGYANGIKARGDLLFIGGMVGWDERGRFPPDFVGQTRQLLANIMAVMAEGGASVAVLEYEVHGESVLTGRPYNNRFASIITVKDRKVTHWRDYLDPIAVFDASGWPER